MKMQDLMELCMLPAPLGGEEAVKDWLCSVIPNTVEVTEDPAGSLIVRKPGRRPGIAFMASLSQPTILVNRKTAKGAWSLQPFGVGKNLEDVSGWEVTDGQSIVTTVQYKDGALRLEEEEGLQSGMLLTRTRRWSQDNQAVSGTGLADCVGCWFLIQLLQSLPVTECEIVCIFLAQEAHNPKSAELASNETDVSLLIRVGTAPVNNASLTGVPLFAGKGPALKLRERYASTDGRLVDLLRAMCREKNIPFQYELLELTVTGLYTAQYGHCGVIIGGIDVPEEKGRIMLSDLRDTQRLLLALAQRGDSILRTLDSLPATRRIQSAGQINGGNRV